MSVMKKKRYFLILVMVSAGVIVALVLLTAGFVGFRWYFLRTVYSHPDRLARASLVPQPLDLSDVSLDGTTTVSFGYARCRLPTAIPFSFFRPTAFPAVCGTSEFGSITLLIPQTYTSLTQEFNELQQILKNLPDSNPLKQKLNPIWQDPLSRHLLMENTVPLPFKTVLSMSHDEFSLYCLNLQLKSIYLIGNDGIYTFKSPYTHGIIKTGLKNSEADEFWALCVANDTSVYQGIYFNFEPEHKELFFTIMKQFISTYQFTVTSISNQNHLLEIISSAGIHGPDM